MPPGQPPIGSDRRPVTLLTGHHARRAVVLLAVAAFATRVLARAWRGEADFLEFGYTFYLDLAANWLVGHGLCSAIAQDCAKRMPLYPLFLAPFVWSGWLYPGIMLVQAAIGAAVVWPAWKLGQLWFGNRAGLAAAAITAFAPYAVVHDTALQDTVLVNALVFLGVWLLVAGSRRRSSVWALTSGSTALALAVLTTARVAFVLPAAALWVLVTAWGALDGAWRRIVAVGLPMVLLIGLWLLRNFLIVGAPVLTTERGSSLWWGNSPVTMQYFPRRSIDLAAAASVGILSAEQRKDLEAAGSNEIAVDRLLGQWGAAYVRDHPWVTAGRALRKLAVVAGAELSPARSLLVQAGYTLVYGSLQVLAAVGLWRARRLWREQALLWFMLLGFLVTTAVFWAHTSHRSVMDAFVFGYAAAALTGARTPETTR
jgi:Dolichyl-phosphate-mannose-protein mannosyltransferase